MSDCVMLVCLLSSSFIIIGSTEIPALVRDVGDLHSAVPPSIAESLFYFDEPHRNALPRFTFNFV